MKLMYFVICLGLVTAIVSCSFITVDMDYDPNINFADYKTFSWMPQTTRSGKYPIVDSPFFTKRLQHAVNRELAAKAYHMVPSGEADFLIAYHITLEDKVEVADYGYGYGAWRGRSARYNNYWGPSRDRNIDVYQYTEARLILDFVDAKTKELIWRGVATGVTSGVGGNEKELDEAVDKMLEKFPPK